MIQLNLDLEEAREVYLAVGQRLRTLGRYSVGKNGHAEQTIEQKTLIALQDYLAQEINAILYAPATDLPPPEKELNYHTGQSGVPNKNNPA